ncbi:5-dehydro-2-deoxygluconokinase [Pseudovibrio axinellae]|uniref:5-dehydro-2-deoxygluconokinase n=1 Tax=Pseudovibrio axinellae TaxID=989403 RepID=A0A165T3S0_9HYPH|nr:sugar kinase [Pseudovibrio axinellae]KZL05387.1 5-dehydro-2-deoxygluconokinase [Pseudovibrio axinellae]SER37478.1 Sugar or nucleoside kinase, ribokinase family [Pseudovibrio axinellae]
MKALFIGQSYIDVTFLSETMPEGDEKAIAQDYAVSFGGNAVTAAFVCAKLGISPDLLCSMADDWLSRMFRDMAAKYSIPIHSAKVKESSLSFIMPKDGKRAIVRCRDNDFLHPVPDLNLAGCQALHVDGHIPEAALHYAKACRKHGIMTSLDGGAVRENTEELLDYIDVAIVSELFCEQLGKSAEDTLEYLRAKGVKVGGVTQGEKGLLWYEAKSPIKRLAALSVPKERVLDTNGAGDTFHGAYVYGYLANPKGAWEDHFKLARSASAHAIQFLGNEASLPTVQDLDNVQKNFPASD